MQVCASDDGNARAGHPAIGAGIGYDLALNGKR